MDPVFRTVVALGVSRRGGAGKSDHLGKKVFEEYIIMDGMSMIGVVGGTFGLFIGFSFIGIIEYIFSLFRKSK